MLPHQTQAFSRISRVSKVILPVVFVNKILIILISVLFLGFVLFSPSVDSQNATLISQFFTTGNISLTLGMIKTGLPLSDKLVIFLSWILFLVYVLISLNFLTQLLKNLVYKQVFNRVNSKLVQKLAMMYTIYLLIIVGHKLFVLYLNWRSVDISLNFSSIYIFGLIWLCAWIMQIGEALYSENEMTI